jgi:hypothetical protein
MATISLVLTFRRQFLQVMVDESPNQHLSLVPAQKNHVYFFKSASKLAKIGTLRALFPYKMCNIFQILRSSSNLDFINLVPLYQNSTLGETFHIFHCSDQGLLVAFFQVNSPIKLSKKSRFVRIKNF